jgi:putative peptidoglycan lipid II flippase
VTSRRVLGLAGAAAMIAVVTVVSRVAGFGRWVVQSYAVGATATGTAYATANQLPNVLFEIVAGGALAGAVVPLLAGPLARGIRRDVDATASALLTWAVLVLTPASVLLAVLARPIVGALLLRAGTGTTGSATLDLGTRLLVVFAPQVPLYGVGIVLTGVLQAQRRFAWPAAAPLANSAVVVTAYLVFRSVAGSEVQDPASLSGAAVAWLGWGTTAGVAAMSLPLLAPVLRSGVRLRPTLRFPVGAARRAGRLAIAGIGALLAQQVAVVVTVALANRFGGAGGTVNLYQYSQAVYLLPYAVLAVPLATAVFPQLAEHAATGDKVRYVGLVSLSTRAVLIAGAVGAAALVAAAPAIAGVFTVVDASHDPAAVAAMGPTLALLAPGLIGFVLVFHATRVLYALERGRAAVTAVATGWLTVAAVSLVAVRALSPSGGDGPATLAGLAVGNTVGMLVAGAALLGAVHRSAGHGALSGVTRTMLVGLGGAGVGAVVGRWLVDLAVGRSVAAVLVAGAVGAGLAVVVVLAAVRVADAGTWRSVAHRGARP